MAKKVIDIDFVKDSIASLLDECCENFPSVSGVKKSSLTVLGKNDEGLVIEVSYPDGDEFQVEHIILKMITKRTLVPDTEIKMFKKYLELKNEKIDDKKTNKNRV